MKKAVIILLLSTLFIHLSAQKKSEWKHLKETEQIVKFLASDELAGRFPYTPGIDKAADFIANEFKKAGLQPWDGKSFIQSFTVTQLHFVSENVVLDSAPIEEKNVFAITNKELLQANERSTDFDTVYISKTDTFLLRARKLRRTQKKNLVIFADTSHRKILSGISSQTQKYYCDFPEYNSFYNWDKDLIVVLTDKKPENWSVEYRQRAEHKEAKNVVGLLPGKKLSNERVVFSAHYDHLGIRKPNAENDSIYNGANDDASGVAAIIQLAHHFSKKRNNERTLLFSAFTIEEKEGFGAMYFIRQYDSASIIADFNIEMIGRISEKGVGAADISGYEHSDFGKILQKNLEGSSYKFYPDTLNTFYDSDNFTLAIKGIPAHTIISSRVDKEPYYHTPDDEWDKLDYKNMNEVIRAIALSATSIISGRDTPTRIDISKLKR
jgi:hypothetical protein